MNLTIFIASYFLIISSVIGYGLFFNFVIGKNLNLKIEYNLLGSLLFLISLSYFTHFFFKHDYFHNLIILITGLIFFFYFILKKKLPKNYILIIFIIFGYLLICYFSAKPHDDFPYYHFPYTYYLNQNNLIIGVGNLNHGFRTPSSIFYLNSLFYLPLIKYHSFHISSIIFMGLSNLILILKLNSDYKNNKIDYIFFLSLLSLLFINIFFYRISEHGTDRSAQILIFILFIELFSLCRTKINFKSILNNIILLVGLIISLKAFYVLYVLIIFPIIYILIKYKINFKELLISLLKNIYFYLLITAFFLLIITNLLNTGCLIYPVKLSCSNYFDWSLISQAELMNDWYELWSKAGANPNFRVDNPDEYIKNFNWVLNWIDSYFFNKVSDFLLGLILLITIVFLTFYTKNKNKIFVDRKIFPIVLLILILFAEWFYNHPSLRYGGYALLALILFIPSSIIVSRFKLNKNFKKKFIILILISIIIFFGRNISRLNNEIKQYEYSFLNPFYKLGNTHFRIDVLLKEAKKKYLICIDKNIETCKYSEGSAIYKKNNYFVIKLIDK